VFGTDHSLAKIAFVRAQFGHDVQGFSTDAANFCTVRHLSLAKERDEIMTKTYPFAELLGSIQYPENVESARIHFDRQMEWVRAAIRAVPCDDPGTIMQSESPYSTYIRLRAVCASAGRRLELFDPYLDADTFHRYLPTIPDGVAAKIITSDKVMAAPSQVTRRDRIVSVSVLLADQFPDRYEFRVSNEQHDRHIRVDDEILHLGGSSKDAGNTAYFTITPMDPVQSTHHFLDGIIARAVEWFGPTVKVHRRS
jgi:hypothetical protein